MGETLWARLELFLYPELKAFRSIDRERMLRRAKEEPLDLFEWIGVAFGVVVAVSLTRYGAAGIGLIDRLSFALVNFVIAVPLIAALAGPFLFRRTRRGLRKLVHDR